MILSTCLRCVWVGLLNIRVAAYRLVGEGFSGHDEDDTVLDHNGFA